MAFRPSPNVVKCGKPGTSVTPACPSGTHECGVNVRFVNGAKVPHVGVHECDHCVAKW